MAKTKKAGKELPSHIAEKFAARAKKKDVLREMSGEGAEMDVDDLMPDQLMDEMGMSKEARKGERLRKAVQEKMGLDDALFARFISDRYEMDSVAEEVGRETLGARYKKLKPEEIIWLGAQWGE
jgi:Zn-dependent oligopeptidase